MSDTVLQVKDLRVHYHTPAGTIKAVDGVTFDLRRGENLGLVGVRSCKVFAGVGEVDATALLVSTFFASALVAPGGGGISLYCTLPSLSTHL